MKQNWNERCPWNLCWKNTNCFILVSSPKDFSKYPCSQVSYFHVFYPFFSFSGVFSFRCCRYFSVFSYTLDCRMGKSCSTINSQPSPMIADFGWSRLFICSLNKVPNNASPREASRSTVTHQVSKAWGILLSHRQPGPQGHVRAAACGCLTSSVVSSNTLYSVIPSAGRKHQTEGSHTAGSLPHESWCEFSHQFDFPLRRVCQAGDKSCSEAEYEWKTASPE